MTTIECEPSLLLHQVGRLIHMRSARTFGVVATFALIIGACTADNTRTNPESTMVWQRAQDIGLEGQGWTDTRHPFDRLPAKAQGDVRDFLWRVSQYTSGVCVHFVTDSPTIAVRWTLRFDNHEHDHMPRTGMCGLDLYAKEGDTWRWVAVGRVKEGREQERLLVNAALPGLREYLLYLPLYDSPESLEIGVEADSTIAPAPARSSGRDRPLCFYGTSITHGGCASRPGLSYPAQLGRRLDRTVINLGLDGNGRMDLELADLLGELDPVVYVVNCLPNMSVPMVNERTVPFVQRLRKARPDTPIVLVEKAGSRSAWLRAKTSVHEELNKALRSQFERLIADGLQGLYYVDGDTLLGDDGEGTVDGVHPNDMGFTRIVDALEPLLRRLVETSVNSP